VGDADTQNNNTVLVALMKELIEETRAMRQQLGHVGVSALPSSTAAASSDGAAGELPPDVLAFINNTTPSDVASMLWKVSEFGANKVVEALCFFSSTFFIYIMGSIY
jgi:hypothetical protein